MARYIDGDVGNSLKITNPVGISINAAWTLLLVARPISGDVDGRTFVKIGDPDSGIDTGVSLNFTASGNVQLRSSFPGQQHTHAAVIVTAWYNLGATSAGSGVRHLGVTVDGVKSTQNMDPPAGLISGDQLSVAYGIAAIGVSAPDVDIAMIAWLQGVELDGETIDEYCDDPCLLLADYGPGGAEDPGALKLLLLGDLTEDLSGVGNDPTIVGGNELGGPGGYPVSCDLPPGVGTASGVAVLGNLTAIGTAEGVAPGPAKLNTLFDEFAALDTGVWDETTVSGTGGVDIVSGAVEISAVESGGEGETTLTSEDTYNLDESSIEFEVEDLDVPTDALVEIYVQRRGSPGQIGFRFDDAGQIITRYENDAGSGTTLDTDTYNLTTMRHLRIREASGNTVAEYSTNRSSWTSLGSVSTPFTHTEVEVYISAFTEGAPATLALDSVGALDAPFAASGVAILGGLSVSGGSAAGPIAPTNLVATDIDQNQIAVAFDDENAGAFHHRAYYRESGSGTWIAAGDLAPGFLEFTFVGLEDATEYEFAFSAFSDTEESDLSSTLTETTGDDNTIEGGGVAVLGNVIGVGTGFGVTPGPVEGGGVAILGGITVSGSTYAPVDAVLEINGIMVPVLQGGARRKFNDLAPTMRMADGTLRSGRSASRGQFETWDIETTLMDRADAITLEAACLAGNVAAAGVIVGGGTVTVFIPPTSIRRREHETLAYASLTFAMEQV